MGSRRDRRSTRRAVSGHSSLASTLLAVTTFLALVAIDPLADASFDAPKRLVFAIGIAMTAIAFLWTWSRLQTGATNLFVRWSTIALVALALISVGVSPHRDVSLDALPLMLLAAAVLLIAAHDAAVWPKIATAFIAGGVVDSAVSLLQLSGVWQPFTYGSIGGRRNISAFIGNDGVLGLVLAFATLLLLSRLRSSTGESRTMPAIALAVTVAGLLATMNVTSWIVVATGVVVLFSDRLRRQPLAASIIIAIVVFAALIGLRTRIVSAGADLRTLHVDALLSYRLGPWAAAVEMAKARPLTGHGPGTFEREFTPHRIAADVEHRRRLANPFVEGSYAEAHSDVLQATGELGIPFAIIAVALVATLLWRIARSGAAGSLEIASLLAGASIAALSWFPMQRPSTAILVLAALGRGYALAGQSEAREQNVHFLARAIAAIIIVLLVVPELRRYSGERRLRQMDAALRAVQSNPAYAAQRVPIAARIAADARSLPFSSTDDRGSLLAARAQLASGNAERAIDVLREAVARNGRPEMMMNLALLLRRENPARLRLMTAAVWVSPALLDAADDTKDEIEQQIERLQKKLVAGSLKPTDIVAPTEVQ